ncbi:MAG: flavin reductase family protein [Desulfobacterales bacterium]
MDLKALYNISYGIYVVSSKKEDRINGQIANTVFQITSKPPTIAVSINKENLTYSFILESKLFTVSILSTETPMEFIGLFGFRSGREIDKFESIDYQVGVTGAPIVLENSIGYIETEVINILDVGTHVVFAGKVVDAQILKDGEPMIYAYYHKVKGGKAPKAAPTYIG